MKQGIKNMYEKFTVFGKMLILSIKFSYKLSVYFVECIEHDIFQFQLLEIVI